MLADVSGILTLRKVINHGNPRWRVSAIVEGKRRQRFFKTKADAQAWGNDIRSLSPCEQFWRSLSNDERRGIMITYHRGEASPEPSLKPMLVESAIDRFLQIKLRQELRPKTLKQIRCSLLLLAKAFNQLYCHQIRTSMIEEWFCSRKWNRNTIDGVIAKIGPFFNWCIRESLCTKNPLKSIILPKREETPVCIFTSTQVSDLLNSALQQDPQLIPYFALGIFAGIRPDEIMRLQWQDIRAEGIFIEGHKSKTRQRRLVKITDNLRAWLSLGGDLPPKNKRKRLAGIRRLAEVDWGHDIMRHTFASYHLARWCSPDQTAHELGHRDTNMLYRHYRELVTQLDAREFWSIRPKT